MAQGQKYSAEVKEEARQLYAETDSLAEVSRILDIPKATVCGWKEEWEKSDDFEQLRTQKKKEREAEAAKRIEKRKESFAEAIDLGTDRIIAKLESDDDIPLNQLSTMVGTLYDKLALMRGEATENTRIEIKLPEEVMEYAE